jgi:hypothetical protein
VTSPDTVSSLLPMIPAPSQTALASNPLLPASSDAGASTSLVSSYAPSVVSSTLRVSHSRLVRPMDRQRRHQYSTTNLVMYPRREPSRITVSQSTPRTAALAPHLLANSDKPRLHETRAIVYCARCTDSSFLSPPLPSASPLWVTSLLARSRSPGFFLRSFLLGLGFSSLSLSRSPLSFFAEPGMDAEVYRGQRRIQGCAGTR